MRQAIRKALRTSQSYFPFLKDLKDGFYLHSRRIRRRPHDPDLACIEAIDFTGRVFVDIGANHGQSIESALLFRRDVEIHSFEPNPRLAEMLRRRYERQATIHVHPVGLADQGGHFKLHIPSYRGFVYDGLASMDRREAEEWLSSETIYGFSRGHVSVETVDCRVETLDAQKLRPAFVKIDVQGLELQVLKGGVETLRAHRPALLIEAALPGGEVALFLEALGYAECRPQAGRLVRGRLGGKNSLFAIP